MLSLALLGACGSGSNPASSGGEPNPTPGNPTDTGPAPGATEGETGDAPLTLIAGDLPSPRDLVLGPEGSPIAGELFVVHFTGREATWLLDVDGAPSPRRMQSSLVGAIAADIDGAGRFYFACLTPQMGNFVGIVTVRRADSSVPDFQYRGLDEPSGVALDDDGGLFVFNRGTRSVVRVSFEDGGPPDSHGVRAIADGLMITDEVLPNHLLYDSRRRLLISETAGDRLRSWQDGELGVLAGADVGLKAPIDMAELPSGNLLVANYGDGRLIELDPEGGLVSTFDTGLGASRLQAVAVRRDGATFVADDVGGTGAVYRVRLP
jgi:hypothetical protein